MNVDVFFSFQSVFQTKINGSKFVVANEETHTHTHTNTQNIMRAKKAENTTHETPKVNKTNGKDHRRKQNSHLYTFL